MVVRVVDGRLPEDWLVDRLLLVDRLVVELGWVRSRGAGRLVELGLVGTGGLGDWGRLVELGWVKCWGSLVELGWVRSWGRLVELGRMGCWGRLVVHLKEPGRAFVLVSMRGDGCRMGGGGGLAAEGDGPVRMHL